VKLFLERAHIVQFGDFSTKALIGVWDEAILGPKPLCQVGSFGSHFDLKFDPEKLLECPSAQLVKVGELCEEKRTCHVHAMGGTVMFTIDKAKSDTPLYKLDVLTVMTTAEGNACPRKECTTKRGDSGCAGHVMLTYPNRTTGASGILMISAGHWIELSKLDTSVEVLQRAIEKNLGTEELASFNLNYFGQASNPAAQAGYMNQYANAYVQCSAPVSYGNMGKN